MATLTANVSSSATTWPISAALADTTKFLLVDDELVAVITRATRDSQRDPFELECEVLRGVAGTQAAHSSGATLTEYATLPLSAGGGGVTVDNQDDPPAEVTTIIAPGATIEGDTATLGSNDNPVTEPFVIQSGTADEAVLHLEATNAAQTGNLLQTQTAVGLATGIGPTGTMEVRAVGEPNATPTLKVNNQNLEDDAIADIVQIANSWGAPTNGTTKSGYFYLKDDADFAGNPAEGAPADTELSAGQCILWFDKSNGAGKLMVKAKTANGTVVTGTVNLT